MVKKRTNWTGTPMKDPKSYFSDEQLELILDYAIHSDIQTNCLVRVLVHSGRRISEVLRVKAKDVMFSERMINFHILKKGENYPTQLKPIDDITLEVLRKYIVDEKIGYNDLLFPYSRFSAYYRLSKIFKKVGISNLGDRKPHPHNFRHTYAIKHAKTLKNPADLIKLKILLDHSDINMTMHYLQYSSEDARQLMEDAFNIKKEREKLVKSHILFIPKEDIVVPVINNEKEKESKKDIKNEIFVQTFQ